MRLKTVVTLVLTLSIVGLVYMQLNAAPESHTAKADIGQPAPPFTLKDAWGKEFKLQEFKDHIVVLEWINQQCPVSHKAHQDEVMQKTYKKFAEKGVIWLAIDTTSNRKPVENRIYAAKMQLAYPVLHDVEGKVGRAYGAATTPHMYVIDKNGKLAYMGAIDDQNKTNYVEKALEELLAGKDVTTSKTKPYGCGVKYPAPGKETP